MNRRDFIKGAAAIAVVAPDIGTWTPSDTSGAGLRIYQSAPDRLLYFFRQTKEIFAANILNSDQPLLGQMKWDSDGKQWCWNGERWIEEHQVYRVQDDDEP